MDLGRDNVRSITFLVNPDQLSALVVLANYDGEHNENVIIPFAAGTFANVANKQNILDILDLYAKVYQNLRRHDLRYPAAEKLRSVTWQGRCRLGTKEASYLNEKLPVVLEHGRQFVVQRLGDAQPKNDGRQTAMRGHPIFVAQHATGPCCRGCLATWHRIPQGNTSLAAWLYRRYSRTERATNA